MRIAKKLLALLLCMSMLMQFGITAYAAGGSTNLSAEISATTAEVDDVITLEISNQDMIASGIKAGFYFDNTKLQVDKITWGAITAYSEEDEDDMINYATSTTSKKKANTDGSALGVYAINRGVDSECYEGTIVTVKFKAIANGEATITLREETVGTDAFKSDNIDPITITIGGGSETEPTDPAPTDPPAHTCTPGEVSYQPGSNGKHTKIVACADTTCDKIYSSTEEGCSGGTATCTAKAECQHCGAEYGVLGDHAYEKKEATNAVHTKDELKAGVAAHYFCDVCDSYFTMDKELTDLGALTGETPDHTWNEGVVDPDSTCLGEGTKTYTCTADGCGKTYTESVDAKGHTFGETTAANEASCEAAGNKAYKQCTVCKKYFAGDAAIDATDGKDDISSFVIPMEEHTVDTTKTTEETTKEPTCTEEGTKVIETFCSCGYAFAPTTEKIDVDPDAHTWSATVSYSWSGDHALCTAVRECTKNAAHTETAKATNIETEVIKNATCGDAGQTKYTATFAETWAGTDSETVDLPGATGHSFNSKASNQLATPADCDNAATYYVQCDNCDAVSDTKTVAVGSANGHAFNSKASNQQATAADCENAATYYVQCDNCDAVDTTKTVAVGSANGHNFSETVAAKDANCQTGGNVAYKQCTACNLFFAADAATDAANGEETNAAFLTAVNAANHATDEVTYTIVKAEDDEKGYFSEKHILKHTCCDTAEEPAAHVYKDFECACGHVQVFDVYNSVVGFSHPCFYGDTIQLPEPGMEGMTFKGWKFYKMVDGEKTDEIYDGAVMPGYDIYAEPQWEANLYTLKINVCATGAEISMKVPYGAYVLDALAEYEGDQIPSIGEKFPVENDEFDGVRTVYGYYYDDGKWGDWVPATLKMPANDLAVDQVYTFNGWEIRDIGSSYWLESDDFSGYLTGWNYIEEDYDDVAGGAWYYFEESTHEDWRGNFVRAEGLTRVPYPTEKINGKTYGPNEADKAIWEANKDTSKYTDAETAVFVFGTDGKFQQVTGLINGKHYAKDGMIGWHPGLVELSDGYYYFIADKSADKLGNTVAQGDTYVTRINGIDGFDEDEVYNFKNGKLSGANGIVAGKYYQASKLMRGAGLVEIGDKYIYVRSTGELVVGKSYWVRENDKGIPAGSYEFDENGYMIIPEAEPVKDGIVAEDGGLYYYENGKRCYAGLIEIDGDIYYVNSSYKIVTGTYYVTVVNDVKVNGVKIEKGTKLVFGEDGKMQPIKSGIVEENDKYYYYENNKLMVGAGLIKIGDDMYYVRSNGQVATGTYYVTQVNDTGIPKGTKLIFGEDGKMQPIKNGIVEDEGRYYYYEYNKLMVGAGVVQMEDDDGEIFYIYVRSNGQLATGKYWPTTRNGYLERGAYDWGTDGRYYPAKG